MKKQSAWCWGAAALLVLSLQAPLHAAIRNATETAERYETSSAVCYAFETPVLGALGADTARVTVRLKDVAPFALTGGPAWRLVLGIRVDDTVPDAAVDSDLADTLHVEMWHGRYSSSASLYRSCLLDSTIVPVNQLQTFDLTTVPVGMMPELTIYLTDEDSLDASYYVDLMLLKGR